MKTFPINPTNIIIPNINNIDLWKEHLDINDLEKIYNLFRNTDNSIELTKLHRFLKNKLELRNKKYGIDCINELNRFRVESKDNNYLENSAQSIIISINQILKAMILHEYHLYCKEQRESFLNQKISYDQYEKNVDVYTERVFQI